MADQDLQALRRAARAGDPAARPALVRALLRTGRPLSEAWDDDALALGPGLAGALEVLAPEAHDAFAADVGWLDPSRLVRHLRDDPRAPRLLAAYPGRPGERWLRVERARPTGPWRVDLAPAPERVTAGADARLPRHRWDARCEALEVALPFGVPPILVAPLTGQLFRRLGVTFQPRTIHRGVPSDQAPYALETLHVDGARRGCVRETWGPPAPLREGWFSAEVEGLPGDPPVTLALLATPEGWFRRAEVVGRPGDLAHVARAWRDVLVAAACRAGRVDDGDPLTRLMPEAWRARARRAGTAALAGQVVDDPTTGAVWSIFPLDGAGFAVALDGDLPQVPDDVVGLRPRIVPIGPAPIEAARADLRATRGEAAGDLAARIFAAVTGAALPETPEVSRTDAPPARPPAPDETRAIHGEEQRFRAAPWTLLRVRRARLSETLRLLHDQGLVLVQARAGDLGRSLAVSLFARPGDAAPRLAAVRAALEQGGWRP